MTRTALRVSFGLYALTAIKSSAVLSFDDDLQTFADLDDLRTGNVTGRSYATYEPDFWLLDGSYKFVPDAGAHVGLMSLDMSDENGDLADEPVLSVTWDDPQETNGLTLRFDPHSGDYASSVQVTFYDESAAVLFDDTLTITSTEYALDQAVSGFVQIDITFYSTNQPYRYLRLMGLDYGVAITFTSADIKAASIIEDTDPISAELRGNALDLQLYSAEADFNILNPAGDYALLRERQPLTVYETIDSAVVFLGQYYLDTWENTSDTTIKFHAIDLIGVMEGLPCRGGLWVDPGIAVEDLLEDLLDAADIPYELDPDLEGTMIIGWLPAGTLRQAVQQIAFAVGAAVDCSRAWAIRIYTSKIAVNETSEATITRAMKGKDQSLALRPVIARVEVAAHTYLSGTDSRELYNGSLAAGTFEIIFSQPMHSLAVTGAVITDYGANYAVLYVETPGTVTLSGDEVTDTVQVYAIDNTGLTTSVGTVLQVTDATLVTPANVAAVAQRVYDYQTQRYLQKLRLYASTLEVGQVVTIDTLYNQQLRAGIERLSMDLAGGMIIDADLVGVAE